MVQLSEPATRLGQLQGQASMHHPPAPDPVGAVSCDLSKPCVSANKAPVSTNTREARQGKHTQKKRIPSDGRGNMAWCGSRLEVDALFRAGCPTKLLTPNRPPTTSWYYRGIQGSARTSVNTAILPHRLGTRTGRPARTTPSGRHDPRACELSNRGERATKAIPLCTRKGSRTAWFGMSFPNNCFLVARCKFRACRGPRRAGAERCACWSLICKRFFSGGTVHLILRH
jgi:hypothetical protein